MTWTTEDLEAALEKARADCAAAHEALYQAERRLYVTRAREMFRDFKARGITKGAKVRVTGSHCDKLAFYVGIPADGFGKPRPILRNVLANGKPGKSRVYVPDDYRLDPA